MISTPKDMNCFFHSILLALSIDYKREFLVQNYEGMKKLALKFKKLLAKELCSDGGKKYERMNHGHISEISKALPEYSLQAMTRRLIREEMIGSEYFDFVSDEIKRDIYILHWEKGCVYKTMDENIRIKNRRSIVLIYIDENHYNLLAVSERGKLKTDFRPHHPLIESLKS